MIGSSNITSPPLQAMFLFQAQNIIPVLKEQYVVAMEMEVFLPD